MKRNILLSAVGVAALFFVSCSKESDNGSLSYRIKPANFTASVGSAASAGGLAVNVNTNSSISWTSGSMNVSEIDFEAKKDNQEIENEYKNLVNVDLLNLSPVIGNINLPDGLYQEVELKLAFKKSTAAMPLTLKGIYTNSTGEKIPVEFYFNEDTELKAEAENIEVKANDHIGYINLQLNKLLTNIGQADLGSATKTNGTIVISSTSNPDLYNKFIVNLNSFSDCDFDDH